MKKEYFLILFLIMVVFFVSSCSKFPVMPVDTSKGFLTPYGFLNFKEVSGKDISCIGKPESYVRGFYHNESDEYGFYVSVIYYVEGDDFDNAKSYFLNKIESCDYKKVSESTSSFGFGNFIVEKFYSVEYEKNNDNYETLNLHIIVQNIDGKKYTLVNLEQNVEKNSDEGSDSEYNSNDNYNGGSENSNYQDVVPFGDAEKYDKEFKSILESVVGTLHLTSFGEQTDVLTYLKYQSERKLNDDDASNIASAFRSKGYNVNAVSIEDPENTIVIQEPNRMITVTFNPNDDILELSIVKLQ